MKNLLRIIILCCVCIPTIANAQSVSFSELKKSITALNSQLPISLGPTMSIESMELSETQLTMRYSINDIGNTISKGAMTESEMHKNVKMMLSGMDNDMKAYFTTTSDLGLSLRMIFTSENTGDQVSLTLSSSELKELINSEVSSEERLRFIIENNQKSLPLSMGQGMTMTKMFLTSNSMTMICMLDETMYNINQFKQNKQQMLTLMESAIKNQTDVTISYQAYLCADTGRGMTYIYQGDKSNEQVVIDIPLKKLIELLSSE